MSTILITGANRGIGRALAEKYLRDNWRVIAAVRKPDECDLNCEKLPLDVTNGASIAALKAELGDAPIDVLWNNAGIYADKGVSLDELSDEDWLQSFLVNTIAPMRLSSAFRQNVLASEQKVFAYTSSKMGSIETKGAGAYAYRSSKAALNMAVSRLADEIEVEGGSAVVLHPGWVQTDMGGAEADITVDVSVRAMKKLVDQITPETQSKFNRTYRNYDGAILPW